MALLHHLPRFLGLRVLALAGVFLLSGSIPVQPDDSLEKIEAALTDADPSGVLDQVEDRVEIVLFGQGGTYRKGQAVHVLRDFFRRYPPDRVDLGSERSSSDDGRTAMGRYWSEDGGLPLQVRVLHRENGDEWHLISLRVERQSFGGR
ncbi:MAG: hypothetical protein Rubg2KO_02960 [Rubricoccaceae bacterium]